MITSEFGPNLKKKDSRETNSKIFIVGKHFFISRFQTLSWPCILQKAI